ncbi:hypothetical protein KUTeg_013973 [Tegillarca granosa]|uniref:protein-serine/threonine phosphatase n=1 Tax=Tegillarca granosa TaxID=220873 RepID=A0ABQ9EV95_TEGGR|nr:hypothetical protein KUTeg_013973 [Tegillarca granosa]
MADVNTPENMASGDKKEGESMDASGPESLSDETKQKAEEIKEQANQFFKNEDYNQAITLYTQAIELNPYVASYYGNRSFAYLRTECFGYALTDATKALKLDRGYIKAYYRRATANMALGKFKVALVDFEAVAKKRPNDKDAQAKYNECKKIVHVQAFQKAIAVEDNTKSVTEQIDIENMYTFKNQKKLHRKYAYQILLEVKKFLMKQPSLVDITVTGDNKFTICGDIHGQYYDLLNIFEINGLPSESNPYLLYPDHFFMSRGNHESSVMNQMYGIMCELLWSDPQPMCGRSDSKRGVGTMFGPDVTKKFIQRNKLDYVIRSHEVKQDGYEISHDGNDTMGNKGAFITITATSQCEANDICKFFVWTILMKCVF